MFNNYVLDWDLEKEIRRSDIAQEACAYAKKMNYIKADLGIEDLSYAELQRLIHIHWLAIYLDI